jgi:hypothetical protein
MSEITRALAVKAAAAPVASPIEDDPEIEGVVEGKDVGTLVTNLKDALAHYSGAGAGN